MADLLPPGHNLYRVTPCIGHVTGVTGGGVLNQSWMEMDQDAEVDLVLACNWRGHLSHCWMEMDQELQLDGLYIG